MRDATRRLRPFTAIVFAASLIVVTPALAGCSLIGDVIENATGGSVDLGGSEVPDDFPSDVPLADGDIVASGAIGNEDGRIWNVTVKVPSGSALDDITAELEQAGFEATELGQGGSDGGTATFTKEPYTVLVVVTDSGGQGWVANYTVTRSGS